MNHNDEETPGAQPERVSNNNPVVADNLLNDSKPATSKGPTPPVPRPPKPSKAATRGLRADSAGMAVALTSQRFQPKLRVKGGGGRGRGHKGEEQPGAR